MGASSRSRFSLQKIEIRIMSAVKCCFWLYSPKNWEFRTICQQPTCDDRGPCIGLGLPPLLIQIKGGNWYSPLIWNEVLLNWMGGEFTSGYSISTSKGKASGKLKENFGPPWQGHQPTHCRRCLHEIKFKNIDIHWCAKIKDEVEKLAYQLKEEAERTERPIRRLSKVMYGSTCADMQVDVMGECLSSIKHVVGVRSVFLAKRLHAV
ncbi:uncharacterized protein TNCV_1871001 [Trichonephila clavipes]|nr:uncharacterized protein TNCV_1871001 [Trichonephila clavipes]